MNFLYKSFDSISGICTAVHKYFMIMKMYNFIKVLLTLRVIKREILPILRNTKLNCLLKNLTGLISASHSQTC